MTNISFKNKTTLNIVNVSYSFTQFSTLAKNYTITAREPSIYAVVAWFDLESLLNGQPNNQKSQLRHQHYNSRIVSSIHRYFYHLFKRAIISLSAFFGRWRVVTLTDNELLF